MTAVCPCCGVHRLTPKSPRIDEVPWGDCACSDQVTCVAHQIDSTDAPSRPTDAMLAEKGQQIYVRRLKEHAETVEHFARFDLTALRLTAALRTSGITPDDCRAVETLYAVAGQAGSHRIVEAMRYLRVWLGGDKS